MFLSKLGWSGVVGVTLVCVACGKSSDGDDDDTSGGTGGSAGHAAAGKGGSGAAAGRGGTSGTGGDAGAVGGGRGGSGGMSAGGKGGASGGGSAGKTTGGAGQGGASAGSGGAGRGGMGGGGGDAGAAEGGESSDVADLDGAVTTVCAAAETCCTAMNITPMLDMCESMVHMYQDAFEGMMRGYVTLDLTILARCKAAYESAEDQCNLNAVVAACEGLYLGHQGVGEPCIGGYDCDRTTDTMTCLITDNTGDHPVGTCQKVPHAKLNEPCFSTCRAGEDCSSTTLGVTTPEELALCFEDDGLYCEFLEDDTRACHSIIPVGEPCSAASFDACGSKALCNTNCEALSDFGEACGSCFHQYQCIDGKCADPLWANESTCMGYPPGP